MIDVPNNELGELGMLIVTWADAERFPPNQTEIARELGVSKTTVGELLRGRYKKPLRPDTVEAVARMTGIPFRAVLDAVLRDTGYLEKKGGGGSGSTSTRAVGY